VVAVSEMENDFVEEMRQFKILLSVVGAVVGAVWRVKTSVSLIKYDNHISY
jgi:hypothetical protein